MDLKLSPIPYFKNNHSDQLRDSIIQIINFIMARTWLIAWWGRRYLHCAIRIHKGLTTDLDFYKITNQVRKNKNSSVVAHKKRIERHLIKVWINFHLKSYKNFLLMLILLQWVSAKFSQDWIKSRSRFLIFQVWKIWND